MPQIVATFSHYGLAHAVFEQLRQFGIPLHYHNIISLEHGNDINNDRFFHLLQQGSCLLNFEVQEEDFIFVYEVICSFGGTFEILHNEVLQRMYQIPEESYEQNIKSQSKEKLANNLRNDLLADDVYIDPNIGIGDYDLLHPIFEEYDDEYMD